MRVDEDAALFVAHGRLELGWRASARKTGGWEGGSGTGDAIRREAVLRKRRTREVGRRVQPGSGRYLRLDIEDVRLT